MPENYIIVPYEDVLRSKTASKQVLEESEKKLYNKESFLYIMGLQMRSNQLVDEFCKKCTQAAKAGKTSYSTYAYYDSALKRVTSETNYGFCVCEYAEALPHLVKSIDADDIKKLIRYIKSALKSWKFDTAQVKAIPIYDTFKKVGVALELSATW